jgi:hypothetical protein
MAEETQHYKTYRLVLDFEVWVNDEILAPYADEEELDEEERQQLTAQRHLLQAILANKQGIYEELLRKRVLEEMEEFDTTRTILHNGKITQRIGEKGDD